MRALAASLLLLAASCSHSSKTGEMAEFAYATGCYQAHQRLCSRLGSEEKTSSCYEDALATCEKMGREFKGWVLTRPVLPASVPAKLE